MPGHREAGESMRVAVTGVHGTLQEDAHVRTPRQACVSAQQTVCTSSSVRQPVLRAGCSVIDIACKPSSSVSKLQTAAWLS